MTLLKAVTAGALALGLAGCQMSAPSLEQTTRDAAKAVVGPIVADTVPGPAGVVLTDCIIDHASLEELARLAAGGATPDNITLVSNILARPETVACATSGLTG